MQKACICLKCDNKGVSLNESPCVTCPDNPEVYKKEEKPFRVARWACGKKIYVSEHSTIKDAKWKKPNKADWVEVLGIDGNWHKVA